jgi:thiamine biosynthesis lipoprotein
VNDNAGVAPVEVDGKIIALLEEGKAVMKQSGGRVNIMMGSVLSIWCTITARRMTTPFPLQKALNSAAEHASIDLLELTDGTAYITDAEASLDVGAIAKGYAAAEQVYGYAKEHLWEQRGYKHRRQRGGLRHGQRRGLEHCD